MPGEGQPRVAAAEQEPSGPSVTGAENGRVPVAAAEQEPSGSSVTGAENGRVPAVVAGPEPSGPSEAESEQPPVAETGPEPSSSDEPEVNDERSPVAKTEAEPSGPSEAEAENGRPAARELGQNLPDWRENFRIENIRARINCVDEELLNELVSTIPDWHRGPLRIPADQIEYLLTTAPTDRTDAAWIDGGKKHLKEWSRCSKDAKKRLKHFSLKSNVKKHLRRQHSAELEYLLSRRADSREPARYWGTDQLLSELASDTDYRLDYRLELNPTLRSQISVFTELMCLFQEKNLPVAGSLLNRREEVHRASNTALRKRQPFGGWPLLAEAPRIRTDGIILLTTAEAVNELLVALCNDCYGRRGNDFVGRRSGRLLQELTPGRASGVAISNTGHFSRRNISRGRLLAEALRSQQRLVKQEEADFPGFAYRVDELAESAGFQAGNLAFFQE